MTKTSTLLNPKNNPLEKIISIVGTYEDNDGLKNIAYMRKDLKNKKIYKLPMTALAHGKDSNLCEIMLRDGIFEVIQYPAKLIKSFFIENLEIIINQRVHILSNEGFHELKTAEGKKMVFVKNVKIFQTSHLQNEEEIYLIDKAIFNSSNKGCVKQFNEDFKNILSKTPRLLVTTLFSLAAYFYKSFDIAPLSLMLVGPTSIGKTVLQRTASKIVKGESVIQTANGTSIGIFDYCNSHGTEPVYFEDAHGKKIAEPIFSMIMNTGNQASRLRSTYGSIGQNSKNQISCSLIISAEKSLKSTAEEAHEVFNAGIDSRIFSIHQGEFGMFDDLCGFPSVPDLIQFIEDRASCYLGLLAEETISYVAPELISLKDSFIKLKPTINKKILKHTHFNYEDLSTQSTRLLDGIIFTAFIGRQAIKSGALEIDRIDIDKALGKVFNEYLSRKNREEIQPDIDISIIKAIQIFIKNNKSKFLTLSNHMNIHAPEVTGLKMIKNNEIIYLIKPSNFKTSSHKKILNNETVSKLVASGLMKVSNGRGHQFLKRLPNGQRESFIAISHAIFNVEPAS